MMDIISAGADLEFYDTQTTRAANILSVQLGSLEYAPTLGIDLRYFLSEKFQFQNQSFIAYCVKVLADRQINVASVMEAIGELDVTDTFNLSPAETSTGMMAR